MDIPDNYYAILGVPVDADGETLKHAYRQLARRYHPDLAGPEGAIQMKRINRAYGVLSDPEKRLNYDTIFGGVIDFRKGGLSRPRPRPRKFEQAEDFEFAGLNIFSTQGPLHVGPSLHLSLGVISAVSSVSTAGGTIVAVGSLDGKGLLWRTENMSQRVQFDADPALTVESLRELRFAPGGELLAGWGRLGLHIWDSADGRLLWSQALVKRAVSAHYSLDAIFADAPGGQRQAIIALPLLPDDALGPRALGVRGTDVVGHTLESATLESATLESAHGGQEGRPVRCVEEALEKRLFWAIRLRALSQNARTLLTLSCAHVPGENDEMAIVRRWNLTSRSRFGGRTQPHIDLSVLIGRCADYTPPYATTPSAGALALVYMHDRIRLYDTQSGTFNEVNSGTMGGSAKVAISPDARWLAVAREDSEINEGVIDLWSVSAGHIEQKLYHPWQISALHFTEKELVVALTDGTIQVWN